MKKSTVFLALIPTLLILLSCSQQPTINGLWQSTGESGTIEFKATGEVIIVDNMSAIVMGHYQIKDDNLITFELIASDILRDSVQPSPKTIITAKIIRFNGDELQLHFIGSDEVESYQRIFLK